QMVAVFLATALLMTMVLTIVHHGSLVTTLRNFTLHSSLFFLAFVMLTEPLTSPAVAASQRWYGLLAGALFPPQVHLFGIYSTPELALVISNAFSYVISPKVKLLPKLVQKVTWGPSVKDLVFTTDSRFDYRPGQYMEWTLPHGQPDNRGSRRYFTLASSPTEETLRIGVKFYADGSSFKQAMWSMDGGTPIAAGQLGGDFVLPKDPAHKLVFIAGGIGITPFRSMLKYLVDTNDRRTVTLLYSERNPADLAYHDVLRDAQKQLGAKIVYTITDPNARPFANMRQGLITPAMIAAEVPDYEECLFYISGSHTMVTSIEAGLHSLGVQPHNVKTDFFPGYA
ncbi:MAG TPA: hypothetical protein VII55_03560, partial [Candidatus Saccharimonadales bacterium]